MTKRILLRSNSREPLLWVETDSAGRSTYNDHRSEVPAAPDLSEGEVVAAWVKAVGADWQALRPEVAVPGVAWCRYGSDFCLVEQTREGWQSSDWKVWQTWQSALAHEIRCFAEGDGEAFDFEVTDSEILADREVYL